MSIHQEQFLDADAAIKGKFLPAAILGTDDFHHKIGTAEPVGAAVLCFTAWQNHRHIRTAIVLLPPLFSIADVDSGISSPLIGGPQSHLENDRQLGLKKLMLIVR